MPSGSSAVASLLSAAMRFHQAGDLASAREQYRLVLDQMPDHPEALYLAGALDYQSGASGDAVPKLERSLAVRPGYLPALEMLGAASASVRKFDQAARCFEMAAAQKPQSAEIRYNHATALFNLGSYAPAAAAFRQALGLKPDDASSLYFLAVALRLNGELAAAAAAYADLLKIQPRDARALDEYGGVLFDLGRIAEAEEVIRRAIAAAPERASPYTNLGRIHQADPARAAEAVALHDQAIARDSALADAHNNRGVALYSLGRFDDAVTSFRRAIALKPALADAHHNLGNALLTLGDMAAGWEAFEWRWKCAGRKSTPRPFPQPPWQGEDLEGKRLLVWGEQGLGDELLYGSMVADLHERGIAVVWETDPRLAALAQRSFPGFQVVARSSPPDAATGDRRIGAQISTASLGRYMRPSFKGLPERARYLTADPTSAAAYRSRLLTGDKTRLVGISWASTSPDIGAYKTSALTAWAPIWRAAGRDSIVVDLQYGDTAAERAAANLDLIHLEDLDLLHDVDGLAALISACDVVVSVSNTTAHLAGALGTPVCVMVAGGTAKLWYWGDGEGASAWYPSARIFKQRKAGDWDEVIARVAEHLDQK
jgi:tetratricopeptide (TPR) repeat protein